MNPRPTFSRLHAGRVALISLVCFLVSLAPLMRGAEPARTGTVQGRVRHEQTGEFLEGARVGVEGTAQSAATDSDGYYQIAGLPAGAVRLRLFYTGLLPRTDEVKIIAGEATRHDVALSAPAGSAPAGGSGVVKLSEFVVNASREMSGAALAINEQRFAPNIKNVVSTDEFGPIAEGNMGEFIKYLPGVTVDQSGGNARFISINGSPSDNVPVTVDGFSLATIGNAGTRRSVDIDFISINNASRVEVAYSPTPETQGSALAGSVNIVPRSSFERTRPLFKGSAYVMMRDNARDFHKVPGPGLPPRHARNVHPGFDFSYVAPVNQRFGYTLSAGYSRQYSPQDTMENSWRGGSQSTNGAAFPHTTPDRPYLTSYFVQDEPKVTTRHSVGATVDFKLTPRDRISLAMQYSSFDVEFNNNGLTFNVGRVLPGDFTTTSTQGAPGAGSVQIVNAPRHRRNEIYMPTITWRHTGPVWKAEAGFGFSHAMDKNNMDTAGFNNITVRRTGVTVAFEDINYLRPGRIVVTDGATGAPVDPYSLASYSVTAANQNRRTVKGRHRTAYANASRDLDWRVPVTLKSGFDLRESTRDLRNVASAYTYVGADRTGSTTPLSGDDDAGPFIDPIFSQRVAPFGFPSIDAISDGKLAADFAANPDHFRLDENNHYRSGVSNSKHAEELISSAYLRGDVSLLGGRLKLIGGVRAEQTNIEAEGPLTDPTRNFQRDASGRVIVGPNGQPLPISTNALEVSRRTFIERGAKVDKEYLRLFPSLNASYNITESLIARAAYYHSVGRPDFNQYAGGLTLPDLELGPTPTNRIVVNNAGIKAWSGRSVTARLEYYFAGVGQFSVGVFRREFEDFFGGTEFVPTPEFLALYGLDPEVYGDYRVATQENVAGTVRMTGIDIGYRQVLTFLPNWARGLSVFANGSAQRATGPSLGAFTNAQLIPRSGSWGVSLNRERFGLRANWNYRGRQRGGQVAAGPSIEPGTYNWTLKRLTIDLIGEYRLTKNLSLFAHLRDVGAATVDSEVAGPNTPPHAQFDSRRDFGSLWTFGVKGTF